MSRFAHLTRNEDCLRALDQVFRERRMPYIEQGTFAAGFVAGWQERSIDEHRQGLATVSRARLAELEKR